MSKTLNIGIAGLGTVGQGVFKLLKKQKNEQLEILSVSARDKSRDRGIDLSSVEWAEDPMQLSVNDNINLVVELIGGEDGIAYNLCKHALENKKHVVTANKALIALHGMELAKIAEKNGVALLFEAAVAGGIPIIKALREGLKPNHIQRVTGILNGTCNYILTAMEKEQRDFTDVLNEAQSKGYAETPPDLDIDGIDAAHKIAIISALAHDCVLNFSAVYSEGVRNVSLSDIAYAKELGYKIRLLGISNRTDKGIEQRVHPCLVPLSSPLAHVSGVLNAVMVESDPLGCTLFTGAGAGEGPTASAVVADILDIASGNVPLSFGSSVDLLQPVTFVDIDHHMGEYYVRLHVKDEPGVLASITGVFSKKGIGVGKILQKDDDVSKTAQIALITHETNETTMQKALAEICEMEYVFEQPHMIRIEA